ncbi:hypothetical protein GJ496_001545 [Pomphorhynchus laevis]|nr:hypothetical protein GJ496_001545 [Pomphorhynchus laevis]
MYIIHNNSYRLLLLLFRTKATYRPLVDYHLLKAFTYLRRIKEPEVKLKALEQSIVSLSPDDRRLLKGLLAKSAVTYPTHISGKNKETPEYFSRADVIAFLSAAVPYVGFGFADNFVMIIAGDLIEKSFKIFLAISPLAAAGLGNAISDITGIGLAHRIELFSFKLLSYLYFNETTNSNKIETILVTRDFRKAKLAVC